MPNDNQESLVIPQIKPETETSEPKPDMQESVLLPQKIETKQNESIGLGQVSQMHNSKKPISKIIIILAAALLILFVLTGFQGFLIYKSGQNFYLSSQKLINASKSQNISSIKTEIANTKKSLKGLQTSIKSAFWMKAIPFLGVYVSDAGSAASAISSSLEATDIAIQTAEPYLAILGFGTGHKAEDSTKTTQERIDFVVKAIPDLVPKIETIAQQFKVAESDLANIDAEKYPVKIGKRQIREPLKKGLELFAEVSSFISRSKPLLEAAPYLLGLDKERTYLVIFQNDKELRPTGGFLTAYSIMKVSKGRFDPVLSNDIYNLDAKYKPSMPAPDPLVKYIKGPYILNKNIRLRDMNWSPDFYISMKQFLPEAQKVGIENVDGIIAVDTQVLAYLLDAIGPIGVPGFGNFSTKNEPKCNCPQVIYELESFADVEGPIVWDPVSGKIVYRPPNSDNRKKIIGPLMNSIFANALGQPKEKLPLLFEAGFKSLIEKHVLFYLNDQKAQAGVEGFGVAGRIEEYKGDYLHINDSNLGGRKSNLYVKTEVEQKYENVKGEIVKTLTITYKNPEKQDGWLNSILPNWVRIYVPRGSQLLDTQGLEDKAAPYEELGKTVFAGFFKLRPEGVSKVTLKYKLPFKAGKEFKIMIQKQPGTDSPLYITNTPKGQDEFFLKADKELKIKI